jgi:phosphatidylserine/phosphatidylglycerophosphate/cardiolipin synthase-like enzyme
VSVDALFTSLDGGVALRQRVLTLIAEASALAETRRVDIHIMTFAFTDEEVANALAEVAARHATLTIRVLADWSQRTPARGQQVCRLAGLGLSNLMVRYKSDQPYTWDPSRDEVRWSYRASRGLLHHKTLCVLLDGCPWKLMFGSFNWTKNAAASYENLLVAAAEEGALRHLMARMELEFEAMWSDGGATLSPDEADRHQQAIIAAYRRDPSLLPEAVVGLGRGSGAALRILDPQCNPSRTAGLPTEASDQPSEAGSSQVLVAFSSRRSDQDAGEIGYADDNRAQRFLLRKPSGRTKRVPLTLTTLALDTIFRAKSGDTLNIAMYGLSTRVAEYGALLDAARRGVRLFILLDGSLAGEMAARLAIARHLEDLPIEVRSGCRMMHQKYVIHPNSGTVLTGTANMTTDASGRHSEHRVQFRGYPALAARFAADFDRVWDRLRPNLTPPTASTKSRQSGRSSFGGSVLDAD